MFFEVAQIIALQMQQTAAFKAFKVKMAVAVRIFGILIAGALALLQNIFSDKSLSAQLFKIAVYRGLSYTVGFKRVGYVVCGEVRACVLLYKAQNKLSLPCFVCQCDFSLSN